NVVDSGAGADGSALLTSSSLTGLDMKTPNTIQELVIDATSGKFNLSYSYPITPTALSASAATGTSALHAGTYYYKVAAITPAGESLPSSEVSAVIAEGGVITLTWTGLGVATSYK